MHTKLTTPIDIELPFGTVRATHVAHAFSVDPIACMVTSNIMYGVDVDGTFQQIPQQNNVLVISGQDFDDLTGAGDFSSADVRDAHRTIMHRKAAADAARVEAQAAAAKEAQAVAEAAAAQTQTALKDVASAAPAAVASAGPVVVK